MRDVDALLERYLTGQLSRREFARRLVTLGVSSAFVETVLGAGAREALAAPRDVPATARRLYLVMVVMDAFRADYLDLAPMPNLEWLMSRGSFFPHAWVGQLESYTPAGHATLSTGATPAHHGVIGFSWRDPTTHTEDLTGWYEAVMAGRLEAQLEQHGVDSIPAALKRTDPRARAIAVGVEKYYAVDAIGGHAADYLMFGLPVGQKMVTRGIPHHMPPEWFLRKKGLTKPWPLRSGQFDAMAMTMALDSLKAFDPRILMINLPGADIYGHRVGGPGTPAVMREIVQAADLQLGRLITAYRDRGILDETIFVVTSDHGMVTNTYQLDDSVIREAIKRSGGDPLFHVGGNSAYIWLKNPHQAGLVAQKMVDAFPHLPTYDGTQEDAVHFAHYLTIEGGAYVYHPVVQTGKTLDPALATAYQYLLGTFAGPLAPDVALAYPENMISNATPSRHGEHGGATWGAQQIPMLFAGPGVRAGYRSPFPARLIDVAPTVLTLLGIVPRNMDGVILADALTHPKRAQLHRQDGVAARLLAYQRAIIAQSQADIAAQRNVARSGGARRST